MHDRYAYAARYAAGKDVLDVACGTGWGSTHWKGARSVTGFDRCLPALRDGRTYGFAVRYVCAEMERLPFAASSFDVVACLEAIEHVAPGAAAGHLAEAARVLRKGGVLVVSTPLRSAGRHSGNPWHLFEYTREELLSLLDPRFEMEDASVDDREEPPVFLYSGRVRQPEAAGSGFQATDTGLHQRAARWLASVATGSGYRFAPGGQETLESTAMGVLLEESLGRLEHMEAGRRRRIAESIQAAQDQHSGLFAEPLLERIPLDGTLHDEEYVHAMATYFALHALDALGTRARHRLRFLDRFRAEGAVEEWLEDLDWSNPWRESNRVMQTLAALLFAHEQEPEPWPAAVYHRALDWLDAQQDPATGLWGTDQGAGLLNAVAGAYHFVPFYRHARRPVRAWSRIKESCLALQQPDGLFGAQAGGGACEDLDVIDLLCTYSRVAGRIEPEVRQALTRAFWAIWNMQRNDGSFPYAARDGAQTYRFSSWAAMEAPVNGGDLWATWFRLVALHTVSALLGDDLPQLGAWRFRRLPALGCHLASADVPEWKGGRTPVWFRELPGQGSAPAPPRVSVVVTCYNLGQYLYEALASVARQTVAREVELLVVDDGSSDPYSRAYLDFLASTGLAVIRTENRGLPAARNAGIERAQAGYICCLDADDLLRPEYLERAAAALDRDPEAGFVSCFYETFDEDHSVWRYTRPRLPEILVQNEAVVASVFRKAAWAAAGGYATGLVAMQDWDLWISILERGYKGKVLPEVLFDYRVRIGSMYSNTRQPANYASIAAQIHARHKKLYQQYLEDVLRLKARLFAEQVEYSRRQQEDLRKKNERLEREIEGLQRRLAAGRDAIPAGTGPGAGKEPPERLEAAMGGRRVSPWLTSAYVLRQACTPARNWAGARNTLHWLRMQMSRQARQTWAEYFDPDYYRRRYVDVARSGLAPAAHYLLCGAWEGRAPGAFFDTGYYLRRHPDVAASGWNPLLHYALYGRAEHRARAAADRTAEVSSFSRRVLRKGGADAFPLVSVIIPCFNYGHLLEDAIQSVQAQTLTNLEVIVVEGGSSDPASVEKVRRMASAALPKTAFYFRNEPHLAGDNRNFGIERARGRYICCLDADDIIEPVYLETAVFLAEIGGFDFVYPSLQEFGESSNQWQVSDPDWPRITRENQVSTVALFRKQIWSDLGGFRDWGTAADYVPEDWDFWLRAVAAGWRGKAIPEPLMRYRVKAASLSRRETRSIDHWRERLRAENRAVVSQVAPRPRTAPRERRAAWKSLAEPRADAPCTLFALPFFTEGGAEKIFLELAAGLQARGEKVIALTSLQLPPSVPDHTRRLRTITPFVYPLAGLLGGTEEFGPDFLFYLLKRHSVSQIYLAGCDFVYNLLPEIHQYFPEVYIIDQLFNDQGHFHANRAYSHLIDLTIVPGALIAGRLVREYREAPSRVAVIPHGVRLPDAEQPCPEGMPPGFAGKTLVGYFGRLSGEKGPLDFVEIAAMLREKNPDLRFVMTGEGPERQAVLKEIRRKRLGSVLHAPGFVDRVGAWMAACDIVAVPSRLDGMPLVIFEAQGLAKTVVASRVGSIPEVIEDGVTGFLCDPGDLAGFASAIARAAASAPLRHSIGEAARRQALENHTLEVMLKRYFQAFDQLRARPK